MREIGYNEIFKLQECLEALSEYHNEVSEHFKGTYPSRPYSETLDLFSAALNDNRSFIAVAEEEQKIVGFCKIDINDKNGKLDYLIVLKECRGKGYGTEFMDWAMKKFQAYNVKQIEVKVIAGNNAIHLYEKYGFKINAHILKYSN